MIGRLDSGNGCTRTDDVLHAERTGRLPDDLAVHVAECASCADALLIEQMLFEDAEVAFRQAELPPAAMTWLRASLAERQRDERLALRPIMAWEWVSATVVAGIAVLMVPSIKDLLFGWTDATLLEPFLSLAGSASGPSGLLIAVLAIPFLAVTAGLVWIWADG